MISEPSDTAAKITHLSGVGFDSVAEQMAARFGAFHGHLTADPVQGIFNWSIEATMCGKVIWIDGAFNGGWRGRIDDGSPERLVFIRPRLGSHMIRVNGIDHWADENSLLIAKNSEIEHFEHHGTPNRSDFLLIDWCAVETMVASLSDGRPRGPIGFQPKVDISAPPGTFIAHLADLICEGMHPGGPLLHAPVALVHLKRSLLRLIVQNVPSNLLSWLDEAGNATAPRQVSQAIDFMQANVDRPITTERVAEAVGTSIRSLQNAFLAAKGLTPSAYLKRLRLDGARADLLDRSDRSSIKQVCSKWGFFHLGRFSETYRNAYGETPSETRKRIETVQPSIVSPTQDFGNFSYDQTNPSSEFPDGISGAAVQWPADRLVPDWRR